MNHVDLTTGPDGYYYDAGIADEAVARMAEYRFQGRNFPLADWQAERIVRPIYGWRRESGYRRFRRFLITKGRKNGKTTEMGLMATDLLYFDDDPWPEIVIAASDMDEAGKCYEVCAAIVEETPALARFARVTESKHRIDVLMRSEGGGIVRKGSLRVISSRPRHGMNNSVTIMDEVHKWRDRKLWSALTTGRGARPCPLRIIISTMPEDSGGANIMDEQVERTQLVLDGVIDDPSTGGFICIPGKEDDPHDERTWYKGNPGLGSIKSLETMREDYLEVRDIPTMFQSWCQLELNMRINAQDAAIRKDHWDACADPTWTPEPGAKCYAGLDLSSTQDFTAAALVFPCADGVWRIVIKLWTPADTLKAREQTDQVPYGAWVAAGDIEATPGAAINYEHIKAWLREMRELFSMTHLNCDEWNATQFLQELEAEGFPVTKTRQGFRTMNAPSKELLRRIADRQIAHQDNACFNWMRANLIWARDPAGNIKPDRRSQRKKIDGFAATINALDAATRLEPKEPPKKESVYNKRAPLVLSA